MIVYLIFKIFPPLRIKEFEEVKDCTFRPKINQKENRAPSVKGVIEVKGLEKFLEHKERKKKIEQERKEREEKIFNLEKNYKFENHETHTIPKPFSLSKVWLFN